LSYTEKADVFFLLVKAYIAELESLVTQLEEENAKMFKEQVLLRDPDISRVLV
jgi:hypothetical protein